LDFRPILLLAPVMLFSIIAHEYAHGYAALKQGDTTALSLGRLTWNPIKHIDPIMTIVLPLLLAAAHQPVIGGAKPVPVDPRNYRNLRRGDIIVSLAGVSVNLVIAIVSTGLVAAVGLVASVMPNATHVLSIVQAMMILAVNLNLALIAFNLIPVPPLDGSHVVKYLLPPRWAFYYQRLGFAGLILLIVLIRVGFLEWWFKPASIVMDFLLNDVAGRWILPQSVQWLFR
jgi:Zn-dependent protease